MNTATNKAVISIITKFCMVKYEILLDCIWHFDFISLNCKNLFIFPDDIPSLLKLVLLYCIIHAQLL